MIPHGYLAHHGILGQKWGVRRYQNSDGSLTEAGKKKYYNTNERLTKAGVKSQYWKNRSKAINDDAKNMEKEYEESEEGKKTYNKFNNAAKKAMAIDDIYYDPIDDEDDYNHPERKKYVDEQLSKKGSLWKDYDKFFNEHEKKKQLYVGKKLVEKYGDSDMANYILNKSTLTKEGKRRVESNIAKGKSITNTYSDFFSEDPMIYSLINYGRYKD